MTMDCRKGVRTLDALSIGANALYFLLAFTLVGWKHLPHWVILPLLVALPATGATLLALRLYLAWKCRCPHCDAALLPMFLRKSQWPGEGSKCKACGKAGEDSAQQ